jgi:tetratricopeptide (TPR) repeat protein
MRDPETTTLGLDEQGLPRAAAGPIFLPRAIVAGRFRILRLLGQGGMAQVFEAEDLELGQNVAIKVLRPERAGDPRARDLVRREVLLARRVTHPNVCRIFDVFPHFAEPGAAAGRAAGGGETAAESKTAAESETAAAATPAGAPAGAAPPPPAPVTLVLVMELVRGETLAQRLARGGALSPAEALPIVRQLADALDAAHRSQVVHGDFKSGNVILEPSARGPRAVVTDFGLARHPALAGGVAGGTTAYMAPEQPAGEATQASDIYAFGVVMYEMVAGRRPEPGAPAAPSSGLVPRPPALPQRWRAAVASCLAPSPGDRPESAAAVARALAAGFQARSLLPEGGRRRLAAGAAMAALLLACLGLVPSSGARRERFPATAAPDGAAARPAVAIGAMTAAGGAAGDARFAWLPAALSHLIFVELAAPGQIEAVQLAGPMLGKAALAPSDLLAVASFTLSAGDPDPTIRVDLQLRRAASGKLLARLVETGRLSQLAAIAARIGDRLRGVLDLGEPTPQDRAAVLAMHPATLAAEGSYAQGLALLLGQRYLDAYAPLTRAVDADPAYAPAHAALARAANELGYGQRARDEALLAVARSHRLPEQQRLEIEAISRSLHNDLPGAAGLFRALWHVAPHNLDYGLQLAKAELAAGKSRQTLETLKMIRRGGPGRSRDVAGSPVLDSLEAWAQYNLSEFKAALAAALSAQARARRAGDDFALAGALVDEANARIADRSGDVTMVLAQARSLFRRLGFRLGEARVLKVSAAVAEYAGDMARALELQDQALAIFDAAFSLGGAAHVRVDKAVNLRSLGRPRESIPLLARALADFRGAGDRLGEAVALNDLGLVESETGDPQDAERHYLDAASLDSELGNSQGLAGVLTNLASLEMTFNNNFTSARQHYQEALRIAQEQGFKKGEANARINVGSVRAVEGNLRAARPEFWKALRLAQEIDDSYLEAHALSCYGTVLTEEGNFPLAESALRRTLALETRNQEIMALPGTYLDFARLALRTRSFSAAEAWARRALDTQTRLGAKPADLVSAWSDLVMAQIGQGRLDEARRTLAAAASGGAAAQDPYAVFLLAFATARLAFAAERPDDAVRALQPPLQRFAAAPVPELLVEGRLLLGTADLATGRAVKACTDLRALADATRRQGYYFVSHEADRLLAAAPACTQAAPAHAGGGLHASK